jgi:tetratricopeptide (TPR) repeat protein
VNNPYAAPSYLRPTLSIDRSATVTRSTPSLIGQPLDAANIDISNLQARRRTTLSRLDRLQPAAIDGEPVVSTARAPEAADDEPVNLIRQLQTVQPSSPYEAALIQAQLDTERYRLAPIATTRRGDDETEAKDGETPLMRQGETPRVPRDSDGEPTPAPQAEQLPEGEDLYSDLLQQAKLLRAEQPADETGDGEETAAPTIVNLKVSPDSFASDRPNAANVAIEEGEELIRKGSFYKAIRKLEEAATLDPGNPLIHLRMSHAQAGAGEFYAASVSLQRAMSIFPSVASVKSDLGELLGKDPERFSQRLAELKRVAQRTDDPQLYLLLCYLQANGGEQERARGVARSLLKMKSERTSQTIRTYARYVLEGE